MNKTNLKVKEFVTEIIKLEKKYGLKLIPMYEQDVDHDYEETPYLSTITPYIAIENEECETLECIELDFERSLKYIEGE
jgi:hypothetical protein